MQLPWQDLGVGLVVVTAAGYVVWWSWKRLWRNAAQRCPGCQGCSLDGGSLGKRDLLDELSDDAGKRPDQTA